MRALFVAALLFAAPSTLADTAAHANKTTLGFGEHGFSIEPPVGHDYAQMQQIVSLALPTTEGFQPNVNVQVQPFKGTIEEYLTVSREQFKTTGMKLLNETHDARTAVVEFTGLLQGRPLHWYSRALLGKNGLILATGTSLESQWARVSATLRHSVDSLRPLP
jgi:hypothetical protein